MEKISGDTLNKTSIIDKNNDTDKSNNKYLSKKRKIQKHFKKNKLFNISYINIDSFFILDLKYPFDYFQVLTDKNRIKLNDNELKFLKEKIKELEMGLWEKKDEKNYVELDIDKIIDINKYFYTERRKKKLNHL